jgi:hypothetical protein
MYFASDLIGLLILFRTFLETFPPQTSYLFNSTNIAAMILRNLSLLLIVGNALASPPLLLSRGDAVNAPLLLVT